ncbi:MAG: SNF2-related protein [Aerococcus sp.]|nr:SNF2-related protein [Aerococcus sp.]
MKWSIPTKLIEEGRQLVNNNGVLKVVPDEEDKVWRCEVADGETYHVMLDGTGKEEDVCHCEMWQRKQYCKHTVAVELFLREHDVVRAMAFSRKPLFRYPENVTDEALGVDFIYRDYLKRKQIAAAKTTHAQLIPLKVQVDIHDEAVEPYKLSDRHLFYVRIHLGADQLYYVTDLSEFFMTLLKQGAYVINNQKHDTYWLVKEAFSTEDYDLLLHLAHHYLRRNQFLSSTLQLPQTKQDQQRYYISESMFWTLVDRYQHQDGALLQFIINDQVQPLTVKSKAMRPTLFEVGRNADGDWLIAMTEAGQWYRYYHCLIVDGALYPIDAEDEYFDDFLFLRDKFAIQEQTLSFDEENMIEFMSLFGFLMMSHALIKNVVALPFAEPIEPLTMHAHIDVKGAVLQVQLSAHYGQWVVSEDPLLNRLPEDAILLREMTQELAAEQLLLKLGFHLHDNVYRLNEHTFNQAMKRLEELVDFLPEEWELTYAKSLENWQEGGPTAAISSEKTHENRYLTINFAVDDVKEEEIERLLEAIERQEDYVQLKDGKVINVNHVVTPEQNRMLQQLRHSRQGWKNGEAIPVYQSLRYGDALGDQVDFQEFYNDLTHFTRPDYQTNVRLKTTLADYQQYAVQWLDMLAKYDLGGMLSDEMGLGKTVQTIAFLLDYFDRYPKSHVLILAPASVLYNWYHEIQRFAPDLDVAVIDGAFEERDRLRQENPNAIWISSYNSYRNDQDAYHALAMDILVLDEAQALKNENTALYQSVIQQQATVRLGLSGTPLENNLQEFWALMQMVLPGLLPDKRTYNQLSIDAIRRLVSPFVLRRTKQDVALELPDKLVYNRYATLDAEQKNIYLAYLTDIQNHLKADSEQQNGRLHMDMLAAITRLRQICCHPRLINPEFAGTSGKFEYFKTLLEQALSTNKRILIFSQFTSMLSIIGNYLKSEDIPYFTITGETKKAVRQDRVDRFNGGERQIFLISLRAGGVGINLTGADTVFLYDLWWNPSVEEQAIGRAHRIGQKNDVQVYRMITEGTIEERISELQEEKRHLFDQLFNEDDIRQSPKLSMDDLRYILDMNDTIV